MPAPAATAPGARPQRARTGAPVTRVLVTGAGGPAAIAAMRSLRRGPDGRADRRRHGPLGGRPVPGPAGGADAGPGRARPRISPTCCSTRCRELGVDVVLPTVDAELRPLARARADVRRGRHRACCSRPRRRSTSSWTSWRWPSTAPGSSACRGPSRSRPRIDPAAWTLPGHRQAAVGQRVPRHHAGRARPRSWPRSTTRPACSCRSSCPATSTRSTCSRTPAGT